MRTRSEEAGPKSLYGRGDFMNIYINCFWPVSGMRFVLGLAEIVSTFGIARYGDFFAG